jgi:hypothetical protein
LAPFCFINQMISQEISHKAVIGVIFMAFDDSGGLVGVFAFFGILYLISFVAFLEIVRLIFVGLLFVLFVAWF